MRPQLTPVQKVDEWSLQYPQVNGVPREKSLITGVPPRRKTDQFTAL